MNCGSWMLAGGHEFKAKEAKFWGQISAKRQFHIHDAGLLHHRFLQFAVCFRILVIGQIDLDMQDVGGLFFFGFLFLGTVEEVFEQFHF